MIRIVVLISGNGGNLQAILDACQQQRIDGQVVAVFSHRATAYGLTRASGAGIPTHVCTPADYPDRVTFDHQLMRMIDDYQPDLVVLAGYMRILTADFVAHYPGRLLNIHPSLLPKYPGLHTHRQVIANGDTEHGATVHFVTEELDGGPVILQAKVPVLQGDTEHEIMARVQQQEHIIYPQVIRWFSQGHLILRDGHVWRDNQPLAPADYATTEIIS